MNDLSNRIELLEGINDLFKIKKNGVEIHFVSGNIIAVIKKVLNCNLQYIANIAANEFVLNKEGFLTEIIGTKYDFESKATYIEKLCKEKRLNKNGVCFMGNSFNDGLVYKTKVKTICVI